MKNVCVGVVLVLVAAVIAGCSTCQDVLSPSDLTLAEVELRRDKASDPQGAFAKSKTCIMLQEVSVPHFLDTPEESLVEVKFERPAKFSLTTYLDNQPSTVICSDGKRGWSADYSSRKIKILDGKELRRIMAMSQLCNPMESYSRIFKKVEVFRCSNDDGMFYRIDCYGEYDTPISVYLDAATFLVRRVRFDLPVGSGALNYDARIEQYELRSGVMIPVLTKIVQNGEKMTSRITSYRLNVQIPETDFVPPVF